MSTVPESKKKLSTSQSVLIAFVSIILVGAAVIIPLYLKSLQYEPGITNISVQEAKSMMDDDLMYPDLIVLDVRTQSEYDEGHIENATLIPVDELELRINELIQYKDTEIIVYCQSGSRSAVASNTLSDAGFSNIFNMLGGYSAWTAAGY